MVKAEWKLNIVATVIDGRLFCHVHSIYEFFEWVTGHKGIMTHQLPGYLNRLSDGIAEHCNIDKTKLKFDIDDLKANLEISPHPDMAAVQFRNFMCNQKGYSRNVSVTRNCLADDPQPDLLDGLPDGTKPVVIIPPRERSSL